MRLPLSDAILVWFVLGCLFLLGLAAAIDPEVVRGAFR